MHCEEDRTEYYDNPLCGKFLKDNYKGAKQKNLFSVLDIHTKGHKKQKGHKKNPLNDNTIPFFYLRFDESPEKEETMEENFSSAAAKMIKRSLLCYLFTEFWI